MLAGAASRHVRAAFALAVVAALAAGCAGPRGYQSAHRHGNYAPPGPPGDPWGPYISQASLRFGVPQQWIRAVMHQESGGREDALSSAGAMGLMQVIPSTYATLRASYGLGDDPYEPHDNIMAGTAYIKEMYDRYGAPGFLAAYNAGPNRLDSYLANGTPLPDETVGYLANIAPRLGASTALSGPLAVYAGTAGYGATPYAPAQPPVVFASASPGSCDPDAAYDPSRACAPLPRTPSPYAPVAPVRPVVLASASAGSCDPDAAYDPGRPCAPLPQAPAPVVTASSVYVPPPPAAPRPVVFSPAPRSRPPVQLASLSVGRPTGSWGIQVGAFLNPEAARLAAADARRAAPDLLSAAAVEAPPTTPFGGALLYRARLASLTPETASLACARLSTRGTACMTVPPGR